jgi:DNA-binding XRE family transcriptional regulator
MSNTPKPTQKVAKSPNNLRKIREEKMVSLAELGRKVNLSPQTVRRLEEGFPCRMDTKRKILEALGIDLENKNKVFGD